MVSINDWISYLNLTAHPEGGYFCENYRNSIEVSLNETHSGVRNLATSIYYMLQSPQISKLHKLKSDEIWYFHYGAPLIVHVFQQNQYQSYTLGINLEENQLLQLILPAGAIFGAEVAVDNSFTIMGCMVAPGFHFNDFQLISRHDILSSYPKHRAIIEKLT